MTPASHPPADPWAERRDLISRATRDAVAMRLDLHPRRLGHLPREIVEAMEMQLLTSSERLLRDAARRADTMDLRLESMRRTLQRLEDRRGERLVDDAQRACRRLADHLAEAATRG